MKRSASFSGLNAEWSCLPFHDAVSDPDLPRYASSMSDERAGELQQIVAVVRVFLRLESKHRNVGDLRKELGDGRPNVVYDQLEIILECSVQAQQELRTLQIAYRSVCGKERGHNPQEILPYPVGIQVLIRRDDLRNDVCQPEVNELHAVGRPVGDPLGYERQFVNSEDHRVTNDIGVAQPLSPDEGRSRFAHGGEDETQVL